MAALTNSNSNTGPADTNKVDQQTQLVNDTISLQELISEANATKVDESLEAEEKKDPAPPSTNPVKETETPAPPVYPTITARVLTTPGTYTAFPNGDTYTTDGSNVLGGDPDTDGDDFEFTFSIINDRPVGTVAGKTDSHLQCDSGGQNCQKVITTPPPAIVSFPASFTLASCPTGICLVTDATVTQSGQPTTYQGVAVLKPEFFAYHVASTGENGGEPLLIFGGKKYNFDSPTGKLHYFQLTADPTQPGAAGPFASAGSSPDGVLPADVNTSALVLLEKDANPQSKAVWLQTSFFVGNSESNDGQSFIVLALGGQTQDGGLVGFRRGGSDTDDAYSFSGDIASLAGPGEEGHFLGAENPNIVIGHDSTGSHNIGRDTPLNPQDGYNDTVENQSGATYHIGIGSAPQNNLQQSLTMMKGYAAGFAQKPGPGAPTILLNSDVNDVVLNFDGTRNTMQASIVVNDGRLLRNVSYDLKFGDNGDQTGKSAYLNDDMFAAIEGTGSKVRDRIFLSTVTDNEVDIQGYMVSADAINANQVLFPGRAEKAFCNGCNYIKWGAWGARVTSDARGQTRTDNIHLGWWIAGDKARADQVPTSGTATYRGDAIGTVAAKSGDTWNQYVATGRMKMDWSFAARSGLLKIDKFDGNKEFGGVMVAPGKVDFKGALVGSNLIGSANGSFVGGAQGQKPQGVIGNFGVGNSGYQATGIFGGKR